MAATNKSADSVVSKGRRVVEKHAARLQQLKVEYVPVASVQPNSYNPNRQSDHDFELLIRSIWEDGFTQPVVIQRTTNEIIDGEHRWTAVIVVDYLIREGLLSKERFPTTEEIRAARDRRLELIRPDLEIPAVRTDMTAEQQRIATLRHNRARGSEDLELSAQVLRDLQELGALDWAQDSLMLDDAEINRLLDDIPAPEALAGEEYGEAWVPDKLGEVDRGIAASGTTEAQTISQDSGGGKYVTAMSAQAIEATRQREQLIAAAKTDEERKMASAQVALYRLSLMFSGDEAVLVQKCLGSAPAERLLTMCSFAVEHGWPTQEKLLNG